MSAIHSPSAAQPATDRPGPAAPAPAPHLPRKQVVPRLLIVATIVVVIAAAAFYQLKVRPQAAAKTAAVQYRTAVVTAGPFVRTLRVAGSTSARNFANIACPMLRGPDIRELILMKLAASGARVKKGDIVAEIDSKAAQDHVDDVDSQVQQAKADVKKRGAEQAIEMGTLRQSVQSAKADLDKAKLDAGAADIRTQIDVELLKLSVEEAEAQYKELQSELPLTAAQQKAELRILDLTRIRHERHRDRHAGDIKRLTIAAPIPGLVVMQSTFRGGEMRQIQEGDQMHPGESFMKVVDTASMQLDATVNQVEAEELRIGQTATIGFDAFPGFYMHGKIYAIGALAVGGRFQNFYIRNIPVRILIEGQDPRLIPDLSASGDIRIEEKDNALLLPLSAVRVEGKKTVVTVKTPGGFETRPVELGSQNNTHAVVVSGLQAGDEVVVGKS